MNSVELYHIEELADHNEECIAEASVDRLLSSCSPDTDDMDGDEPVSPRLGDQYQVDIPALLTEYELFQLRQSPISTNDVLGAGYSSGRGLAIPIMWAHHADDHIKHEQQGLLGTLGGADTTVSTSSIDNKEGLIDSKYRSVSGNPPVCSSSHNILPQGPTCKVEFLNESLERGEEFAGSTSQEYLSVDVKMAMGLPWLQLKKVEGYIPLPESPVVSWTDMELQSYLLGLYIFGKNLTQVKEFMGNKEMGDILSFYYGRFYRSDAHQRWSACRKIRSRRFIHGQRIFTGWRLQELLSRMFTRVPKEVQDNLLEVAKSFSEGRASLEEFVLSLKAMVGMELLVEAVGIGKGKRDLTGIVLDPAKSNQAVPSRPEIPVGKACSSLTSGDIIKFLTGDFRLSKAKSNDLFWEAVWPRLLARGWHSEQPKHLSSVGSKNALVFLIPGIKKFSRKKLTKGDHYYDSVADVLNKVASDPMLIEFEVDGAKGSGSSKNEYGWDADTKLDQKGLSNHQRHCYLRPRLSSCNSELVKFTIVDTSLVQGEVPFKVRELRSLPINDNHSYSPSTRSGETGSDNSERLPGSDILLNEQVKSDPAISDDKEFGNSNKLTVGKGTQSEPSDHFVSVSKRKLARDEHDSKDHCCEVLNDKQPDSSDHLVSASKRRLEIDRHDSKEQCREVLDGKQPEKDTKCHYSRRTKSSPSKYLSPVSRRQRLTACKYVGTERRSYSFSRGLQLKKEEAQCEQKSVEVNVNLGGEADPTRGEMSNGLLAIGSVDESINSGANCFGTGVVITGVVSQENPHACSLIDLNLPQFSPDFDTGRPLCTEMDESQDGLNQKEPTFSLETKPRLDDPQVFDVSNRVPSTEQPIANARRQSTRNRPPTTRALEALACGFLSTKRKWRDTKAPPSSDLASKPSRRARRTAGALVPAPTTNLGIANPNVMLPNVDINEEYNGPTDHPSIFSESHVPSERKEDHQLLGILYCSETLD